MPRRRRRDEPGLLHHVFARGISRRSVFGSRSDVRYFLSLLAREVRSEFLHVLAFCLLSNHFHLLVRSLRGELSACMQRVLQAYVRRFNRRGGRDGPLFRSRFASRPVDSEVYLAILHRYIDDNPVQAGLVASPSMYPYGSAALFVATKPTPWLGPHGVPASAARPPALRGGRLTDAQRWVVERRMEREFAGADGLDLVTQGAPDSVVAWLRRRARAADGDLPAPPMVPDRIVHHACEWGRRRDPGWSNGEVLPVETTAWDVLESALWRELSGMTMPEIARRSGRPLAEVRRRLRCHARAVLGSEAYARRVLSVVRWCVGEVG